MKQNNPQEKCDISLYSLDQCYVFKFFHETWHFYLVHGIKSDVRTSYGMFQNPQDRKYLMVQVS